MTRRMKCPYCGYERDHYGPGAAYCGPHRASFGPNEAPKVLMIEVQKTEGAHPASCECAECWQAMDAGSKI